MRALAIASTGMNAQQTNLEVISNNIANINTTGFKKSRAEFSDLLYQTEKAVGVANRANQSTVPEGANIGLGVQTAAVRTMNEQGELSETSNELDVAIVGRGYIQVQSPDGATTFYTRAGSLNKDSDGNLVTTEGYKIIPNITIPTDATEVKISESGEVSVLQGDSSTYTTLGQLETSAFVNPAGLKAIGDNLFQETASSGNPINGVPGDAGYGYLKQGYLESSNVDSVTEITSLISAQRAYEMNSKVITTADEMAQIVSKNLK
ncbi:flagellar basal-body rod protein FlgG [Agrobacterium vitis]|uniref:Flagellar basal-body rod protein FlgG n=1 Tax=Agrobacterium vitis TaxID=373 RepID=A0ABD6GK90_AGRVI|nr:flagellar basal-body rod protein FlgG [Agrobacterium vitis]MUO81913.1 flagellar basal-body rod protein FlgG [Agrobacterium vitis]MUO97990.1 flagellar basal-body rod protein FlgG [Agrobacterium vitis]MUP07919.1 flagellar basal-body rod protein FlgG [Agrobacterium vitis]MUZ85457.1 flagellar basal-body rod protein FlgG [Agrobacterium vitis]MVA12618.1 flagellar basal-body rod protein FlgG [Agrobacterium vitis]